MQFRAAVTEGTKLLPKQALLHFTVLYLRPDSNNAKGEDQCLLLPFAIVSEKHVMALLFTSERLGVGRQMILEAVRVALISLFFLDMINILRKTQGIIR